MGNTIKLVSGVALFFIGAIMAYGTITFQLVDILFIVGLIIAIVGIILLISFLVDSNANRTSSMIEEFLDSRNLNNVMPKVSENLNINNPFKSQNDYYDYNRPVYDDSQMYYDDLYYEDDYDDSKYVLNRQEEPEYEDNFDNQLEFTPYYEKPMKVTRTPKKRDSEYQIEEIPEFVVEPTNNSNEIQQALARDSEPVIETIPNTLNPAESEMPARDIKIDINNPESLPIPKSLNSFVLSDNGVLTTQEAFDNLAVNVTKEIMLEIPSLNDLSDRFLSHVPTIYSRVIINEFDVSDMHYMFLISSLLKQGVHIKTVPKVHSTNLITDDSHAMIISESYDNIEYGAIYNDRTSISNIRADFEKTWNIASSLDENIIKNATSMGGN
ncbi:MAG: hypothetical protein E7Z80_05170 [Methanobrevibacter thaueri]|nr:hypothetical protein [Methanobrevibacter thaueri]